MTATRVRTNVDDFSDDAILGEDARRRLAVMALSDKERAHQLHLPLVYEVYWDTFTDALTEFKEARDKAFRDQLTRDRVMLPRGNWLILGRFTLTNRRHKAMLALQGEAQHVPVHDVRAILGGGYDGGAPRAAARQIVGSCWPRYRRALTLIHAATDYLRKCPAVVDEP